MRKLNVPNSGLTICTPDLGNHLFRESLVFITCHDGDSFDIRQKRSLFDTLGDIATKDTRGVYVLKHKPERPPKKAITPIGQASSSTIQAQAVPSTASLPVAPAPVVPPPASSPQDDLKLRPTMNTVPKHVPEVPMMTNGKPKPVNAQPITVTPPTVSSPVTEQHRASVPPAVNRTPVPTGAILANSPTPVPQYTLPVPLPQPPAASPRAPSLPANTSQPANKSKPVPSASVVSPTKPDEHLPPTSAVGAQVTQSHPQLPTVVQGIPSVSEF